MPKIRALLAVLTLGLCPVARSFAQDAGRPAPVIGEMQGIVSQVREKMKAGKPTAETLAAEIAAFDALLAKYPEKNNDTGQVAMMKATLYLQVIGDEETAKKLLTAVAADYAGTSAATQAARLLDSLTPEAKAKAKADADARQSKLAALIGAPAPQLDFTWASMDGLKSLADLKGKIVILDFWATWCGPCIAAFPKIREEVAHFKGSPVVVLGVTSLQGRVHGIEPRPIDVKDNPAREYELTAEFMKQKEMTWPVAFSQQPVFNPDYAVRGIPHLAILAPDGTVRHNGMNPHDPKADVVGKVTALLKEFKLPVPATKS